MASQNIRQGNGSMVTLTFIDPDCDTAACHPEDFETVQAATVKKGMELEVIADHLIPKGKAIAFDKAASKARWTIELQTGKS